MVFAYEPAQQEDILRASAYHRTDYDHAVISFPPREHGDIATSLASISHASRTRATVGELKKFPPELINKLCLELDLVSLSAFRQTNLGARDIVNSIPEFRAVVMHSLDCVCALLRTGAAQFVTLGQYFQLLCEQKCTFCAVTYGSFVHLPTWSRCCMSCIDVHVSAMQMVTAASVERVLNLTTKIGELPSIKTLPGAYSLEERRRNRRVKCFLLASVRSLYRKKNMGREISVDHGMQTKACRLSSIFNLALCCRHMTQKPPVSNAGFPALVASLQSKKIWTAQ